MLADEYHEVLPDDPHADHIEEMLLFKQSQAYEQLSSSGKQMFEKHFREHLAAWCEEQGEPRHEGLNAKNISQTLSRQFGIKSKPSNGKTFYIGIGPQAYGQEPTDNRYGRED